MLIHKEIIEVTNTYFEDVIDYQKLTKTSKDYKEILENLLKNEIDNEEGRIDIELENGKAIGTL